jgi:pilus assembly protein CpaB
MAATWTTRPQASSSNRRALLIALVFGLLSAFLVYRVLTAVGPKGGAVTGTPVVVAKQDIPARTLVTADMVTLKPIPDTLHLAGVLTDNKVAVGQYTKSAVQSGQQLVTTQLTKNINDLGFSGTVPDGMRAISISVTEVSVAGGLIQPGDSVDVLGVFQIFDRKDQSAFGSPNSDGVKSLITMTVLQDVQVLAVGQTGADNSTSTKVSPTKGQPDVKTVTLAVTPEDAERLALGQDTGDFSLSLHKAGDHTTGPVQTLPNVPSTFTSANAGASGNPGNPATTSNSDPAAAPTATSGGR